MITVLLALTLSTARADTPPCMDEAAILDSADSLFPARADQLRSLRTDNPERFAALLHHTAHLLNDPELMAAHERVAEASARVDDLGHAYKSASAREAARLEPELLAAIRAEIEAEQALKRLRVQEAQQSIADLRAEIADTEQNREAIIDDQMARFSR